MTRLRVVAFLVLVTAVSCAIQLPDVDTDDLDSAGFVAGEKLRYADDPDAEAARSLSQKMLPFLVVGWGLVSYVAYKLFTSQSWISVAGVAAVALLIAKC